MSEINTDFEQLTFAAIRTAISSHLMPNFAPLKTVANRRIGAKQARIQVLKAEIKRLDVEQKRHASEMYQRKLFEQEPQAPLLDMNPYRRLYNGSSNNLHHDTSTQG